MFYPPTLEEHTKRFTVVFKTQLLQILTSTKRNKGEMEAAKPTLKKKVSRKLGTPESQSIQTKFSIPMLIYFVIGLPFSWRKEFNF